MNGSKRGKGFAAWAIRWIVAVYLCLYSSSGLASFLPTNAIRADFWDVAGKVRAVGVSEGTLIVGGDFSYVAPPGGKALFLDLFTAEPQSAFPEIQGQTVHAIVEDGQGGWYVGGEFHRVGEHVRAHLAHVLSDATVDLSFHPEPDGPVRVLALRGSTLYIGGHFSTVAGVERRRLAALDVITQQVLPWNPGTFHPASGDYVATLALSEDAVYAGGFFNEAGGSARRNLAAIDLATGEALPGWIPDPDGVVLSLDLAENRLIVGGQFNLVGGQARNGLAALDVLTGDALATWNPAPTNSGIVNVVHVDCSTVYVGGDFNNLAGVARSEVGAVELETGEVLSWAPGIEANGNAGTRTFVNHLEVFGSTIYLAGEFGTVNGQVRRDLAAVDAQSGEVLPWTPDANGTATRVAVAGRTVVAGFLSSPGGVDRHNLAAFDLVTGRPTPWTPQINGTVTALAVSGDTLYVGGDFTEVDAMPRPRLAAFDLESGDFRSDWNSDMDNGAVLTLAVGSGSLVVGGSFTSINGNARRRLAAWDLDSGELVADWDPWADGIVRTLIVNEGVVYAGGDFFTVDSYARGHLAAIDVTNGDVLPGWQPSADFAAHALAAAHGRVFVGGDFTTVNGQSHARLAVLDGASGELITDWNTVVNQSVRALAPVNGGVILGGLFSAMDGLDRFGLGALTETGAVETWSPGLSRTNRVFAMTFSEQALVVGGDSGLRFQGTPGLRSLAVFPMAGSPVIEEPLPNREFPVGETVSWEVSAQGADPISFQWYFNGAQLPGETNATLLIPSVDLGAEGTYGVLVTNLLGSITAEARLRVTQPARILTQPVSQTVAAGATVTLSVLAEGQPAPLYQWRLNGVSIPGAVNPTFVIVDAQPVDGGSYEVVVANSVHAELSQVAQILVLTDGLPANDQRALAGLIEGDSGEGMANNVGAGLESGEPEHAGRRGGASIWLRWIASESGIAQFHSRGSAFDTLLAVYTLTNAVELVAEASDDDRGGFATSRVLFNAAAGTEYFIAIDGLAGAMGDIVLSWSLEASATLVPRILVEPESQSLSVGQSAIFAVGVVSPSPVTYQWFRGCQELPGETNDTLMLAELTTRDVGFYRVVVMNASSQFTESLPARLEVGPQTGKFSFDKLEELLARVAPAPTPHGTGSLTFSGGGNVFLVQFGGPLSHAFNTTEYNSSLREVTPCGIVGEASAWLIFQSEADGVVSVDTVGSSFDTLVAVYREANLVDLPSAFEKCDNDGAPDGIRSLLRFDATASLRYLAYVAGVNGAKGEARINWRLGLPPVILTPSSSSSNQVIRAGDNLVLEPAFAGPTPPEYYQWLLNGQAVAGQTNGTLFMTDLGADDAGLYTLVAGNFAGCVTNNLAWVQVDQLLRLGNVGFSETGVFEGVVEGNPGQWFKLETSSNLTEWSPLLTNQILDGPVRFRDPESGQHLKRFYKVRWP